MIKYTDDRPTNYLLCKEPNHKVYGYSVYARSERIEKYTEDLHEFGTFIHNLSTEMPGYKITFTCTCEIPVLRYKGRVGVNPTIATEYETVTHNTVYQPVLNGNSYTVELVP